MNSRPTTTAPPAAGATLGALPTDRTIAPADPRYDDARRGWNLRDEQHPAVIVSPTSVDEVRRVVLAARADGLRIAVHSTGHNNGPLGPLRDAVLLRTDLMRAVTVDPTARRVRAAAGARWDDVVRTVAPHGLSVLHGSSPTVGVVGYTTGGGIGWYSRRLGLAAHALIRAEVVLPDGTVVTASDHEHADLLWAMRGGGAANFGVVTEVELTAFPFASAYAGFLAWPESRVEKVLTTWAAWAADAPVAVTTSFRVLAFPDLADVPEMFRGRRMVLIDGAVLAEDRSAGRMIAPLRDLHPDVATFARVDTVGLTRLHMDPEAPFPVPLLTASTVIDELPVEAIDAFVGVAGAGSDLLVAEIRQLGGAMSTPRPDHAALSHVPGRFAVFGTQLAPEVDAGAPDGPMRLVESVQPWSAGRAYLNFVERPADASAAFTAEAWDRLRSVRATYDPSGAMRAVHPIPLPDAEGVDRS